jgi:hypothetical protein
MDWVKFHIWIVNGKVKLELNVNLNILGDSLTVDKELDWIIVSLEYSMGS